MLLRVSSESQGAEVDLQAIRNSDTDSGVPHSVALTTFAEAAVRGTPEELVAARDRLREEAGAEAVVDAAAVIGNFQRMVRIADGTGIPLDKPIAVFSVDMREELGLDAFGAAANTPAVHPALRMVGRVVRPLIKPIMSLYTGRGR
jgi:hypothetical protein